MKRTLRYLTKPIGLVMALVMLVLPVLFTPGGITACPIIGWTQWPDAQQDCRLQTDPPGPERFCEKVCEFFMDDECDSQCGTTAIMLIGAACLYDVDPGACDCLVECEDP